MQTSSEVLSQNDRFLRLREVLSLTGRSKTSVYSDPNFPRPVKLSMRQSAWIESEVKTWMNERVLASRGDQH
ncbi:MAG: hypothetical protein RLZZ627_1150 [Pseudomonadota bacterium]|jgi:prophage regulatory protein